MDKAIGVITLIVGITALSVVVSKRSDTAKVLTALFGGLNKTIRASVSPVTGK